MDAALRFPVRQRCAACRRYFGFAVVMGLFDTDECARLFFPEHQDGAADLDHVPRTCKVKDRATGVWQHKRAYPDGKRARRKARQMKCHAYDCPNCSFWHLASKPGPYQGPTKES